MMLMPGLSRSSGRPFICFLFGRWFETKFESGSKSKRLWWKKKGASNTDNSKCCAAC